jgi:hypothetical protein
METNNRIGKRPKKTKESLQKLESLNEIRRVNKNEPATSTIISISCDFSARLFECKRLLANFFLRYLFTNLTAARQPTIIKNTPALSGCFIILIC